MRERTGADLLEGIVRDPHDTARRLVYADWLEENGDLAQANFIRSRCALDRCVPDYMAYPTYIEQCAESAGGIRKPEFPLPPGFSTGCWWDSTLEVWWSDSRDTMEGGLLSYLLSEPNADGESRLLVEQLGEIVRTTPVRGFDFDWNCAPHWPAILASPVAQQLRRISLEPPPQPLGQLSLLQALAVSPVVRDLRRLEYGGVYGSLEDPDAEVLADTPFERLERLELLFNNCSLAGTQRLMSAPWFRRLHRLEIRFNRHSALEGTRLLGGMPRLHTLALWGPDEAAGVGLGRAGTFPELRRLLIHASYLKGEQAEALARLDAPQLIELWLRNCGMGKADLKVLAAAPLFRGLRVLTFDGIKLTHTALDAVAASPCAARLRILRLRDTAFQSLARSALGRGAFPALTTLVLSSPFSGSGKARDTADFLARLHAPNLRHLELSYCDFDGGCARALTTNPSFAGLTRLVLRYTSTPPPEPATLRRLLLSENLRNLIALEMWSCPLQDAAEVLADHGVMPHLTRCVLDGVPRELAERLREQRPVVRCSD